MMALRDQLAKYDALVSDVSMSDYGYWAVTYSVAPGLSMSVTVCKTGITREQARDHGNIVLTWQTGQRVRDQ
jgi:hypothetical protein